MVFFEPFVEGDRGRREVSCIARLPVPVWEIEVPTEEGVPLKVGVWGVDEGLGGILGAGWRTAGAVIYIEDGD